MVQVLTDRPLDAPRASPNFDALFAPASAGHDGHLTLVYLFGEHDLSNRDAVAALIDHATTLDETDVELDLSRVAFMSAATVHVIIDARANLRKQCRSLTIVSPTPIAIRLLELCGVAAQAA